MRANLEQTTAAEGPSGKDEVSYPPIYVISLAGSADRRAGMKQKLTDLGLEFEFLDAVDGRQMDVLEQPGYDAKRRIFSFGKHLTGGEWGCLLSHKAIYEKMAAENIKQAVIFEDDAVMGPKFPDVLQAILEKDLDFDVVRFMGSPKIEKKGYRRITPLHGDLWLARLPSVHGGAHAYLISLQGAQKMLSYMDRHKIFCPIDTLLGRRWETGLNCYAVNPIVRQDLSFDSAIGEERFDKSNNFSGLGKVIFPFTRAWHKITENIGKRWVYASSFGPDKALQKWGAE